VTYFSITLPYRPTYEFKGMGIDLLNGYMKLFNLGQPTGIELPGEYRGILPGPQRNPKWSIGDTLTTAIGQGDLEVTPLQMCMVTACFANRGLLLQPKIVREVRDGDGKVILPFERKLIRDVTKDAVQWPVRDNSDPKGEKTIPTDFRLEQSVMQAVREGMLKVTTTAGGTAASHMYNQMGTLLVAGKTGTAEYGEVAGHDKEKGTDLRNTRAWFTAYAPYDKPQYAVTALIASGGVGAEGSTYAVPIVKEILQYLFPHETGMDKPANNPNNNAKKP
jgi:penicillin-binding protein 2